MRLEINQTRLFFDVVGSHFAPVGRSMREKPTLILLHGGPGADHSFYRPHFDALAEVAQVIYLDHRGQGRSDPSSAPHWNLDTWADDVRAFCEALEIERPVVLGHSFGGMVALRYAARFPDHPSKLIFASTYARQNLDRVATRFGEIAGPEIAAVARRFWGAPSAETVKDYNRLALLHYSRRKIEPGDVDTILRAVHRPEVGFHFMADEMKRFDLLPALARVRCPTLVIGGALDPVCPIEDQEDIVAALPSEFTRFERFEDCGHTLWADAPDRLFELLREFLAA